MRKKLKQLPARDVGINFDLYPKQLLALTTDAQCVLYGGAAGGGKSHLSRVAAIVSGLQIAGLQVYIFRRHYNDLLLNHMQGPTGFRELLHPLIQSGRASIVGEQIRFPNGSTIHLCHCQYDSDVEKYRGAEIHFFIPEETTQFTEFQLRFLMSRVRIPDTLPIPVRERHKWPRILMPTNPGGLGHAFIKSNYIDNVEPMTVWKQSPLNGGRTCIFIPARLEDNPSIDPEQYRNALLGLKRPELIDAMLNGSWDIPIGAFFPEADERIHVLPASQGMPRHWFKFRTFDWGSGAPAVVQWWAVADGQYELIGPGNQMFVPPRGALILYREWYIAQQSDPTKGLGLSNHAICEGILERTPADEHIQNTITDARPFAKDGGLTIAVEFEMHRVPLEKGSVGKGSREIGWQQLRSRLIGIGGTPYIYFLKNCNHTWRELTEIQTDPYNVEDLDSSGSDHALDAAGLACKARSFANDAPRTYTPQFIHDATFNDVFTNHLKIKKHNVGRR